MRRAGALDDARAAHGATMWRQRRRMHPCARTRSPTTRDDDAREDAREDVDLDASSTSDAFEDALGAHGGAISAAPRGVRERRRGGARAAGARRRRRERAATTPGTARCTSRRCGARWGRRGRWRRAARVDDGGARREGLDGDAVGDGAKARARASERSWRRAERERERRVAREIRPEMARAVAGVGDFEARAAWRFGSRVLAPLIKMVAPRDAYAVTCAGKKLRIDGELRGIDSEALARSMVPKWRRGKFSLIYDGDAGERAALWFVDHETREVVNAMEKPTRRDGDDADAGSTSDAAPLTEEEMIDAITDALLAEGAAKKKVRTEGFKFAPVKGWIAGKASAWIGGRKAEIWEATAKLARETVAPGGGFKLDGSFEEYVESANDARENVVTRAPLGESSKDESGLNIDESKDKPRRLRKVSARCWLVRDFPLKASQASQILDVLERANKNAAHVNRVVKYWCSNHENMFPVKIQVPLMLTIYAQVQFKDFKALDKRAREAKLRDGFFEIPSDYRVKSVDEMLAEVEERANRDMERIEALDESLDVDNETEEIRQLRVELERLAKNTSGEDEGDDEYEFDDDDDDDDEDDENLDADRMNVR